MCKVLDPLTHHAITCQDVSIFSQSSLLRALTNEILVNIPTAMPILYSLQRFRHHPSVIRNSFSGFTEETLT